MLMNPDTGEKSNNTPEPYTGRNRFAFVSYSHADNDVAMKIINALQQNGIRIWYDSGLAGGAEHSPEIEAKIKKCDVFFLFASSNYFQSTYCHNEYDLANLRYKKTVIPIIIDDTSPTEIPEWQNLIQKSFVTSDDPDFWNKIWAQPAINNCIERQPARKRKLDMKNVGFVLMLLGLIGTDWVFVSNKQISYEPTKWLFLVVTTVACLVLYFLRFRFNRRIPYFVNIASALVLFVLMLVEGWNWIFIVPIISFLIGAGADLPVITINLWLIPLIVLLRRNKLINHLSGSKFACLYLCLVVVGLLLLRGWSLRQYNFMGIAKERDYDIFKRGCYYTGGFFAVAGFLILALNKFPSVHVTKTLLDMKLWIVGLITLGLGVYINERYLRVDWEQEDTLPEHDEEEEN